MVDRIRARHVRHAGFLVRNRHVTSIPGRSRNHIAPSKNPLFFLLGVCLTSSAFNIARGYRPVFVVQEKARPGHGHRVWRCRRWFRSDRALLGKDDFRRRATFVFQDPRSLGVGHLPARSVLSEAARWPRPLGV